MGKVNRVQTMVASEAKKLDFILDVVVSGRWYHELWVF